MSYQDYEGYDYDYEINEYMIIYLFRMCIFTSTFFFILPFYFIF